MLPASLTAAPSTQASSWDTAPPQTGNQVRVSPLIDLYPEHDSDLEALYEDSLADQEQDTPFGSEADPADLESLCSED